MLGQLIGDLDLLRGYSDIIFEHRILVRPLELVIIVMGDFFARDSKNGVPKLMLCLKIYRIVSILHDST